MGAGMKWTEFTDSYWKPIPELARAFMVGIAFGIVLTVILWALF